MKPLRILVVDDDPQLLDTIETALNEAGYETRIAEDGKTALKLVAKFSPEVIVTDILMPEKDGYELIMELRRMRSPAKIIAMSSGGRCGYMIAEMVEILRVFKVKSFLSKPFKPEQLLDAIRKVVQ